VFVEPPPKTTPDACELRHTDEFRIPFNVASRFFKGEVAEAEEGFARSRSDEVRIASTRVQHMKRGESLVLARKIDQPILQLEWRELLQLPDLFPRDMCPFH
jgi:hypothetical protein